MPAPSHLPALRAALCVMTLLACRRAAGPQPGCLDGTRPWVTSREHTCVRGNGVREGPGAGYYEDGTRRDAGLWRDNKRQGPWAYYREDGSLWQRVDFEAGQVRRVQPELPACRAGTERHGDMPPLGRAVWCQESSEKRGWRNHGPFLSWHDDARPQAEGSYLHGEPDGEFSMWYPDGSLKARGAYSNGKEQGLWLSWHDNGRLFIRALFEQGKEHGPWVSYWEEGGRSAEGSFQRGAEAGHWRFWRPSGGKSEEGDYLEGKKHGWWRGWDADGNELPMEEYRQGVRVGSSEQRQPASEPPER